LFNQVAPEAKGGLFDKMPDDKTMNSLFGAKPVE